MNPKNTWQNVTIVNHPLLKSRLTTLRDQSTARDTFRQALHQTTVLLAFEATSHLPTSQKTIHTPLAPCTGHHISLPITLVPIMRAGLGMANALLSILPEASVGHIGLARNEKNFLPQSYYFKQPPNLASSAIFLLDPMLATGHSAALAASELKKLGAPNITLINIIAATQGLDYFTSNHPEIPIFTAAVDPTLNDHAFIVPGLGDAGDRYFGT